MKQVGLFLLFLFALSDLVETSFGDTLISWGSLDYFGVRPPAEMTNIVAISAKDYNRALALTGQGEVVTWGSDGIVALMPRGLTNVVAISSGQGHDLALRADGTVVQWGFPLADG